VPTLSRPGTLTGLFVTVLVALLLNLAAPVAAQGWVQRTTASAPPARNSSPAAYDVHRGATVLFGGYDGTNTPRSDTWEWNGTVWNLRVSQVQPAGRWGHGMAFDSKRGRVVLFGGFGGAALRNDTWEWDGVTWTQRSVPTSPPVRAYFGMTYDAERGVVVAFGGLGAGQSILGDTWEYNGTTWTQRSTATAPSPRRGVAMTWDETRRETLLFGGGNGTTVGNDLWAWNGTTWSQKSVAAAPPARWEGYFAFDGNCGRALLYGGTNFSFTSNFGDSWAWDGLQWTQLAGAQPSARYGAAMAHDAQRGQFVVFGGRDAAGFRNDLWELGPSCNRTMSVVTSPIAGQTAQFLYSYPPAAGLLHFCWTLVTPRQPAAFAVPISGLPSIGLCRVDIFNQLLNPAVFLDGSGSLVTAIPIPPSTVFNGFQFDVQSVDMDFFTLALRWAENDVEATTAAVAAPVASFTATPTIGAAPLAVQFTDTSTGSPTSWQWDFNNDGTIDSTQQNPSWTYTSIGVYSVRLVASNFAGSNAVTRSGLVFVGWPNPQPNPALNMVAIAPGTFQMGQVGVAEPVHQVTLSAPFWMGKYEVTQAEYQAVVGSNPSYFQGANAPNAPQRPVETVSWNSAVAYCQALTATEQAAGRVPAGYQYRLPTEAEWEYCCRAGTTTEWHTGTSLSTSQANFQGALANATYTSGQTAVVGSYAPNAFGLHDMHGNVWEWCLDSFATYAPGPVTDPFVTGGANRVFRGGSWSSFNSASNCRSALRGYVTPGFASLGYGFRVVLAPVLVP
jgi:formylglycine-generating enzyme required for sulfatase activity